MERRTSASRRIAKVLLSVVLVLGLMPAPAFAGDGANDAAGPAVTATQGGQDDTAAAEDSSDAQTDSLAAQQDAATIAADDSNGGESLSEAGVAPAPMEPDTTAGALDLDAAPASDGASALSEGGASRTPGWTQSGTCEWKIDGDGLLTVRPLGDGASGELADWVSRYNGAPWYSRRDSIKSAVVEPGVSARTCYAMFYGCSSLASLDLSGLDTSRVTDMGSMFVRCSSLSSLDLSPLDTSAVTHMAGMFSGCSKLTSLDLSSFDTSAVADMCDMFGGCSSLATIYASPDFDTGAVKKSYDMFSGCSALRGGNGTAYSSSWTGRDRARVDGYDGLGYFTAKGQTSGWKLCGTCEWAIDGDGRLTVRPLGDGTSGELADWGDTAAPWCSQRSFIKSAVIKPGVSAKTCRSMFLSCSWLVSLDLSSFDTSKVTDMSSMFSYCSSLKTIFVSRLFTTDEVEMSNCMFDGCCLLAGGAGTVYDPSIIDASRARIDGGADAPGYLTKKREEWEGDANGNGVLSIVDAQIAYDIATTDLYKNRSDYVDICLRADITGDGTVHAEDAFAIQYAALRGW